MPTYLQEQGKQGKIKENIIKNMLGISLITSLIKETQSYILAGNILRLQVKAQKDHIGSKLQNLTSSQR